MSEHRNAQLIRETYQSLEQGDMQPLLDLLSDDVAWVDSTLGPLAGNYDKARVPQFFADMMNIYHDTLRVEIADIVADDDHAIVLTHESGTTHGGSVAWTGVHVWTFRKGRASGFTNYASADYQRFWNDKQ